MNDIISPIDPKIAYAIKKEKERQHNTLTLIASENYAYPAVEEAMASVLGNKYAEGYPGKRYYAGCRWVDEVELLAIGRSKGLFSGEHANVQPNAGSAANMAVYIALLNPGDTIMGLSLSSGGHLTHGQSVSFSGILYKSITYDVDPETELLDYSAIEALAKKHKPKLIIAGASAYSRMIDFKKFQEIASSINAFLLADCAHIAGFIATGLHPKVFPYADAMTATTHKTLRGPRGGFILCKKEHQEKIDKAVFPQLQGGPFMNAIAGKAIAFHAASKPAFKAYQEQVLRNARTMATTFQELGYRVVSGGTDTHLFILDLRPQGITGRTAEKTLEKAGISVSRSTIPFDPEKPWVTSGIRIGTLAMSTRGCIEKEAEAIAHLVDEALKKPDQSEKISTNIKALLKHETPNY